MGRARHRERTCKACGRPAKGHQGQTGYRLCQYYKDLQRLRRSPTRSSSDDSETSANSTKTNQVSASKVHTSRNSTESVNHRNRESKNRTSSITRRSTSLDSTKSKPGKNTIKNVSNSEEPTLTELMLRVSEMQSELKEIKMATKEKPVATPPRPRYRHRRSSSVDSARSVESVDNRRRAYDHSPASSAGQPGKAAIDFIREDREPLSSTPRPLQDQPVTGLRPVPNNVDISRLKSARGLPEKTVKAALKGEFTDLSLLYEGSELSQNSDTFEFVQTNTGVSIQQKVQKKRLNNFYNWLEAWTKYEKIMVEYHGTDLYLILADYKLRIMEFDRLYNWNSVYMFDKNHRQDLGGVSIEFSKLTHVNMTTNLNSNTLKKCSSLKSK